MIWKREKKNERERQTLPQCYSAKADGEGRTFCGDVIFCFCSGSIFFLLMAETLFFFFLNYSLHFVMTFFWRFLLFASFRLSVVLTLSLSTTCKKKKRASRSLCIRPVCNPSHFHPTLSPSTSTTTAPPHPSFFPCISNDSIGAAVVIRNPEEAR